MNIHIASDGTRTIRLTKTEINTLRRAKLIVGELCRSEPSLVKSLDDWGACGLAELLELPFCKERQAKEEVSR